MSKLSSQEQQQIQALLANSPLKEDFFQKLVPISFEYDEHFFQQFDQEFLKAYLKHQMPKKLPVSAEEFYEKLKHTEITAEDVAAYGGSWIMTELISQFLEKMKEQPVTEALINNLVGLVACRNEMFAAEKEDFVGEYKAYLSQQLQTV